MQETGSQQELHIPAPADRDDVVRHLLFFTLLWVLLTEGALISWVIGIVIIPLATWAVVRLQRPAKVQQNHSVKLVGLLRFLPFFFWQSLRGGWECALFAIHPRKRLSLGFLKYTTQLPCGSPRLYFFACDQPLAGHG